MNPSTPSPSAQSGGRLILAASFGFAAVLLGAFGAHSLNSILEAHGTRAIWQTAVLYHFLHTLVLLFLAREEKIGCWVGANFATGIVLFSGSLYLYALTGVHWLGFVTPFGGLAFLIGWFGLILTGGRAKAGKE